MNKSQELFALGQSVWYDNIQRRLLLDGELARMVEQGEIYGVTSNPSIFMNAIAKSQDYDASLLPLKRAGKSAEEIYTALAIEDIQAAADVLRPLYERTGGEDGYVSLEVSPYLAHDTAGTLAEAKRLWQRVARPNLMIKIPATVEGLPAVREAIAAGINVNVTLIFALRRYGGVMAAYIQGLEQRLAAGLPLAGIASVASFFVSRVDSKVDPQLEAIAAAGGEQGLRAKVLLGKAAIANARLAYADFQGVFASERFRSLQAHGARPQRPLWASTSTKNPAYRDVLYVEELIGPGTVNTIPPQTLAAFLDHGVVRPSLAQDLPAAQQAFVELAALGIEMNAVTAALEAEGVQAFAEAYSVLLAAVEGK